MNKIVFSIGMLLCGLADVAEAQSVATYGGGLSTMKIASGGSHISTEEYLYIGPGTYEIDGIWEVYSKNIAIDPAAIINGNGSIQIYNPAAIGKPASRTHIDGNASNNQIEVNIVLNNADGMELRNIDFPNDLVTVGFSNNTSSSTYVGKDLNLAVDGADVWLDLDAVNLGNLHFDNNATVSNYSASRMIITNNSIISHVVRDAGSTGFFFPVGIADGDYTPAQITGNNEYNVSVQNYAGAIPVISSPSKGMDRTWHLYGGTASVVTLIHNAPSTDGINYIDANAFITRYLGAANWSSTAFSEYIANGVHTNNGLIGSGIPALSSADASYLTKASDPLTPLPITLIDFKVFKKEYTAQLEWATVSEQNNKGFEIERSDNGVSWKSLGFIKSSAIDGNSSMKLEYNFTDETPLNGHNYYRLKQLDLDGKHSYSSLQMVIFENAKNISIAPNPANDFINVKGLRGHEQIDVFDALGRLVRTQKSDNATVIISLSQLIPGNYIVRITDVNGGNVSNHKIIIAK